MTAIVRLYWILTLLCLPLAAAALLYASGGRVDLASLASHPLLLTLTILLLAWALLGGYEIYFSDSNLRRNYPVLANIRYMLEYIRPEIQQYFIANNTEERPFSRERRNLIYRRAKGANDTLPFGTQQNILAEGYRSLNHSIAATSVAEDNKRVTFGNSACRKPYSASRLNVSGMSFGALSGNAIAAMNKGAKAGNFAQNTGEGGISDYHLKYGGDLIWQIGTGYFGCRNSEGRFDAQAFAEKSSLDVVKMIELKLSQGAKPSHGGVLPGAKVTAEIARIRSVEIGKTVLSPANHPEFSTPVGLLEFIQRLRELSQGKPVGFKFCLGRKTDFMAIVKAMLETGIYPDFITIDGAEGGTGAAPAEFSNRLGTPCMEATYYVNEVLIGAGIREQMQLISSGDTASGFDLLEKLLVGANTVNAARAFMMTVGCVQAQACNTNHCPTGVATQDPARSRAIDVAEKAERVKSYHHNTLHACFELCGAMGFDNPDTPTAADLYTRYNEGLKHFDQIYTPLQAGQLLGNDIPEAYRDDWQRASAASFQNQ
ncbi:MAG: FMN-binding glutamate synthase family protein [Pseudomonadales bacterium]|nr:FMN-binding glutamate synthase family protein [Pseudomonadales bacterium]